MFKRFLCAALIFILLLSLASCTSSYYIVDTTYKDEIKTLEKVTMITHTNLDGVSVYSSLNSVLTSPHAAMRELDTGEVLLLVNGSLAEERSAYLVEGTPYVDVETVAEMLGMNISAGKTGRSYYEQLGEELVLYTRKTVGGKEMISLDDASNMLRCDSIYSSTDADGRSRIIRSMPSISIWKCDEKNAVRDEEKALSDVRKALITSYEKKYGTFTESCAAPLRYDEQENLRYLISNLRISGKNERFYIVNCIYDFYVDKFSYDIFTHYVGHDETFRLFDANAEGALAFPG